MVCGSVQLFHRKQLTCAVGLPLLLNISQIREVQPTSGASLAFTKVLSTSVCPQAGTLTGRQPGTLHWCWISVRHRMRKRIRIVSHLI